MKTQYDGKIRSVTLNNLQAMCRRISGHCHRYTIVKVSRSRVHVEYSNPDEYGNDRPVTAVYPCVPGFDANGENPVVLLGHCLRTIGTQDDDLFFPLENCPNLWRDPVSGDWKTREEISGSRYLCPDNEVRTVDWNHPYTGDTFAAFEVTNGMHHKDPYWARTGSKRAWKFFLWSELKPEASND